MNFFKFLREYTVFIIVMTVLFATGTLFARQMTYEPEYKATIPMSVKLVDSDKSNLLDVNQYLSANIKSYENLIASYPFTYAIAREMNVSNKKIADSISTSSDSGTSLFTINVSTKSRARTNKLSGLVIQRLTNMNEKINKKVEFVNMNPKPFIQKIYEPSYAYYGVLGAGLGFIFGTIIALIFNLVSNGRVKRENE